MNLIVKCYHVILVEVVLYKHIIFSRFKGSHTNKPKQNKTKKNWEYIATKLTANRGIKKIREGGQEEVARLCQPC